MSQSNYKKKSSADVPSPGYIGLFYSSVHDAPAVIDENGNVAPFAPTRNYTHTQSSASLTWTINHNLGFNPSVEILSVGGVEIEAQVTHTSVNQTIINFVIATAGTARLN